MIDLTTKEQDKDNFIMKVYMQEDSPYYFIRYASGREEQHDLTIHNLNATFLNMERQYMEYKEGYIAKVQEVRLKANLSKLIEGFLAIVGIFLTTSMPFPVALKVIIDLIILVSSIYYQKVQSSKIGICDSSMNVLDIASYFLKNKHQFMTTVHDPKTGTEEDWYLVTLSEIEEFANAQQLGLIGAGLNDEIKAEESERTNKVLRKIYNSDGEQQC